MLAFITHVYQDHDLARRTLKQLRHCYSTETVICIADGTTNQDFGEFCSSLQIIYIEGDRLKLMQYGGLWLERAFTTALRYPWEILIKFDPDTCFWRPFQTFPSTDWFGNLQDREHEGLGTYISGGCVGFRRQAVEQLIQSDVLKDPIYGQQPYGYRRFGTYRWPYETPSDEWITYCDLISGHIAKRLGWTISAWSEVWFDTRMLPPQSVSAAASHPHPQLPLPFYLIQHYFDAVLLQEALTIALSFEKAFRPLKPTPSRQGSPSRQAMKLSHFNFPRLSQRFLEGFRPMLPQLSEALDLEYQEPSRIELQITAYRNGDYYKPHRDNSAKWCAQRQISFTCFFHIQPKAFQGGQVLLDPGHLLEPECSTLVCFPSGTKNQIFTVSGENNWAHSRFSLDGWVSMPC